MVAGGGVGVLVQRDAAGRDGVVRPGEVAARAIAPAAFWEIWGQAQERPDGFMGMFA